ncbi:hypothetical protein NPIL_82631 [Nephila pilipes]|uniref:Uncharacterized protein n=1 Tax=Nephila pilipes TaxID=299642 RepID=A0A8X6U082_NEPPI|nr:hypothetical protein NPIL_82631 [Nephila pilipes]
MCISLADGQRSTEDVPHHHSNPEIEGRKFDQELIALPKCKKGNSLLEYANDQHPADNLDVNLCTLSEEEGRCYI